MFKNETHNHPTEIEPFGGAATCLGGAIRDPLSGRSYVYQAMRVSGSADPREPLEATLPGKLPQRTISTVAARGYSSYGNQIGIATGQVHEFYHPGYKAKHMEIGAVLGAVPESSVSRREPAPGDLVLLIGGRTGRDGIGGATGSSKEHSLDSLAGCGAEVQKGNPPTERKLQRLFRNPDLTKRIRRCNDFGAGGVAVAVGELAPGLEIDLDAVPRKYEGLNGTELAISESQERMAVVIAPEDLEFFIRSAADENLEATLIARVTAEPRLVMRWRGRRIVDLSRAFLDTNGAEQTARARIDGPLGADEPFAIDLKTDPGDLRGAFLENLGRLEVAGQEGLGQLFDSTIGASSLLGPFGGKHQTTPVDGMAALLPASSGECRTASLMSFGFDPRLSSWSPYHGAICAVLQSAARITRPRRRLPAYTPQPAGVLRTARNRSLSLGKAPRLAAGRFHRPAVPGYPRHRRQGQHVRKLRGSRRSTNPCGLRRGAGRGGARQGTGAQISRLGSLAAQGSPGRRRASRPRERRRGLPPAP